MSAPSLFLIAKRTSTVTPSSLEEENDGHVVLGDGTEWEASAYLYEMLSDVYICPAQGTLLLNNEAVNVVRVR